MVALVKSVVLKLKASFFKSKGIPYYYKSPVTYLDWRLDKIGEKHGNEMVITRTKTYKSTKSSNERLIVMPI